MKIKPIGDLLLIERLDIEKTHLLMPIPEQKSLGKIIDSGKGILNRKNGKYQNYGLDIGDIVIFQTHRGHSAKMISDNHLFLSLNNVLCVYKKEDMVDGKMDISININDSTNNINTGFNL